jgi:hypothetical protein
MAFGIRIALVEGSTHTRRALSTRLSETATLNLTWALPTLAMGLARMKSEGCPDILILDSTEATGASLAELLALPASPTSPMKIVLASINPLQAVPEGPWQLVISKPRPGQDPDKDWPPASFKALTGTTYSPPISPPRPATSRRIDIVAIGISTGGPTALEHLISELPHTISCPILIVQHVPVGFDLSLAQNLARRTRLKVALGTEGAPLLAGCVFIAPAGQHMIVRPGAVPSIGLTNDPPEQSCRPAVDPLFRSLAAIYGGRVLALVMTGMGEDGLRGVRALKERGANIVVQDEASSVVWGMPGAVARAGLADKILPLAAMASEIAIVSGRK